MSEPFKKLDEQGRLVLSPISLVAIASMRPVSLGERVRRYMKTPQFLQDQHNEDGYDDIDELIDRHENPLSPYEERSQELLDRVKKRKFDEKEAEKEALIEKEKAEKDAFRKRFNELRSESNEPPLPFPNPEDAS